MSNNTFTQRSVLKPLSILALASALAVGCGDSYTPSQKSEAAKAVAAAENCNRGDSCAADESKIEASPSSPDQVGMENAQVSDTALEAESVSVLSANNSTETSPAAPLEKLAPLLPPAGAVDVDVEVDVQKDEGAKTTVTVNKSSDSDDKPTGAEIHLEVTREKAICKAQGGTYNDRTGRCQR